MDRTKKKLAVGAVAVAALAGGGAAIAAGGIGSSEDQQAILEDAAKKLGVEPEALESALEDALAARLDEAVAAGRLTEEQATELKERLESGTLPLFGGAHARLVMARQAGTPDVLAESVAADAATLGFESVDSVLVPERQVAVA